MPAAEGCGYPHMLFMRHPCVGLAIFRVERVVASVADVVHAIFSPVTDFPPSIRPFCRTQRVWLYAVLLFVIAATRGFAATYYVAPTGSDTNSGTITSPFATVQRGQTAAAAGDTVYLRGGTYTMAESQIAQYSSIYAYVTNLTKSGTAGNRINYWAYPGEQPIFDYSNVKPANYRVIAFEVSGSWIHLRGIVVTGVQVTITTHTQSECFENTGSNNIYEQLVMHDGMGIGYYLTKGSNNLVLNCDAYRNWDSVSEGGTGGNTDGFGGHPNSTSYTGNVFRACRAWFNSDDGYDCINAYQTVTFEQCWSFFNGYNSSFTSLGDGNGFKGGGYGAAGGPTPSPIPMHVIQFCLSVRNKANGFYSNHHVGGSYWYSNTAYQNGTNYNMLSTLADNDTDVPGYGHVMKNNLGYSPRGTSLSNLDQTQSDVSYNFFTLPVTVTGSDFASTSTDTSVLEQFVSQPRKADGRLPDVTLLHLVAGSDLIDAGISVGFPFLGSAPDLGAFEFGGTSGRTLTWKGDGTANAWDLNTTANWGWGTVTAKFGPTDDLVFSDGGSASPAATLTGKLWPASVTVGGTQNYAFTGSGTLGGAMTLTKNGTGTLTVGTANTFTGATSVNGGTLAVTGSLNGSAVTVGNLATLRGPGTITGSVVVAAGGTLADGLVVAGTLDNAGTVAVGSGTLSVSGNVTNSGTLRVIGGAGLAVGGTFTNTGLLDLLTATAPLPATLVNRGAVLTASNVTVQSVTASGSAFVVTIRGYAGHNYQLARASALGTGAWANVGSAQAGNGGVLTFTDLNPASGKGFYRVLVSP